MSHIVISGGGPCSLLLTHLLMDNDPTMTITIYEKAPCPSLASSNGNDFGFAIGERHLRVVRMVKGLEERVQSVARTIHSPSGFSLLMVGRQALVSVMLEHLQSQHGGRVTIVYNATCGTIDFEGRTMDVWVDDHLTNVSYDALVAADGVHSSVRSQLAQRGDISAEKYLSATSWKAFRLPPQPDLPDADALKRIRSDGVTGFVVPRHPKGYSIILKWTSSHLSPWGCSTVTELHARLMAAVPGLTVFDVAESEHLLQARAGRETYVKVDRYHHGRVALIGDAAHGMYPFLGQGLAAGLDGAARLAHSLMEHGSDIETAFETYSAQHVPEAQAIAELNLIDHLFDYRVTQLLLMPILFLVFLPTLFRKLNVVQGPLVPFTQLHRDNWLLLWVARHLWRWQRQEAPSRWVEQPKQSEPAVELSSQLRRASSMDVGVLRGPLRLAVL